MEDIKKDKESMGNIDNPKLLKLSKEELMDREYRQKQRELRIARIRAGVVRNQITRAYEILENIRFDYLGDTAFRDKITTAKQGLERAMSDFLLSDNYWEEAKDRHNKLTPFEYDKKLNIVGRLPAQGDGK